MRISCSAQAKFDDATCTSLVGGYNTTVLMVADPGDFSGSAEAKYYNENLEVRVVLHRNCVPPDVCQNLSSIALLAIAIFQT